MTISEDWPGPVVPDVRRIVVLRANAVGDFVLTLPALDALKACYPDATLALLGNRWHTEFLRDRPGPVDEAICLPPIPGITAPAPGDATDAGRKHDPAAVDFVATMRSRRFDLALQLHGGGRFSNPFVLQLGARVSAGFRSPDAAALDRNFPYRQPDIDLHPRARLLQECVGLVGAVAPATEPALALTGADVAELEQALPDLHAPIAVLQPGATDPRRRWHAAGFAAVGDALSRRGAQVVINGGPNEAELVRDVRQRMREPAIDAAGLLSVGGLCALLARSRLLVSNDTGPAHLARALGISTVTLYWIGNLHSYGPLSARLHRVGVSHRIHCPVCNASCIGSQCAHRASFIDDIPVPQVVTMALEQFDSATPPAAR
ncbi:glycosyltransferase family 9 protein [Cupriavidus sp. AU9028]|uniref:glycosyltransferase family 9 protein n=1 Tax=Cupriavidus sp. AU9028 TaxID=2871157 RepID=UPI001C94817A|nr:glycosyltransferase family 9 protein [Cupriavidus sp. AU9028]MBY4897823.1 glycosyltransferase family 9 protein [Cupriavidus sp. AU9028]